jgi:dTDP-4-dehydrorhamnose reductase
LKILLTGRNGQVGYELERVLSVLGEVIATDRSKLDLAVPDAIRRVVREAKPDVIVNAAAYTAVDRAETERELARQINGVAPGILAEEAKRVGASIVHFSTDYVFNGNKTAPYVETDLPAPLNVYGQTKLEGERAVAAAGARYLILRTSWVYGPRGKNFFLAIARKAATEDSLRVVDDQTGAPTTGRFIAESVVSILQRGQVPSRIYHLAARGITTWYSFACAIVSKLGLRASVTPIATKDYPASAARPLYSVLDTRKIEGDLHVRFTSWEEQLDWCVSAFREATARA